MKKMFLMLLALCLMASLLCVTAFAADEPAADIVIRLSGMKKDGTIVKIEDYKVFEDGWNAAMELGDNSKEMNKNGYIRVVVDLYADWNAVEGQFTEDLSNGSGFNLNTIYFRNGVRMTLNLNGHTVNRGLTEAEMNGEVMHIDEDADVVIKNGTITGGFSNNGAGGININDGAKVVLENVNLVGNRVEDDDGAAIAAHNGAKLTMNGGSISNNALIYYGDDTNNGTVYLNHSTAIFNEVTFSGNEGYNGAVVYACESTVTLNDCIVENNEKNDKPEELSTSSIFFTASSELNINGGEIKNNGSAKNAAIFNLDGSLNMTECTVTGNNTDSVFVANNDGGAEIVSYISNCNFTENKGLITVQYTAPLAYKVNEMEFNFVNCEFNNNDSDKKYGYSFYADHYVDISLIDCKIGNTTFCNKQYIDFGFSEGVGSVFGAGSVVMIVTIAALVVSVASIGVTVACNKKKTAPVNAADEDEE